MNDFIEYILFFSIGEDNISTRCQAILMFAFFLRHIPPFSGVNRELLNDVKVILGK